MSFGTAGNDSLAGGTGPDVIAGLGGDDTLIGGDGADVLLGDEGDDLLDGGADNDLIIDSAGRNTLSGGDGDDTLSGAAFSWLDGGAGRDFITSAGRGTIQGGTGDDTILAGAGDLLATGSGVDAVILPATLPGSGGPITIQDFTPGDAGDSLSFGSLLAGSGTAGYHGENPFGATGYLHLRQDGADVVVEWDADGGANGFTDIIRLQGVARASLTAVNLGFAPDGNDTSRQFLIGTTASESLSGSAGNDYLFGSSGNDTLFGGAGADALFGQDGNDLLDGDSGANSLAGGAGDDIYVVRSSDDIVTELEGQGVDVIRSWVSTILPANVEILVLEPGAGLLAATGNDLANTIIGNESNNRLDGELGDDLLNGGLGNDTLSGGGGNDTLVGGPGADSYIGGAGIDLVTYEAATEGIRASFTSPNLNTGDALGDRYNGIENIRGTAFIDRLVTASGPNRLEGLDGNDELIGGAGADTLDGGNSNTTGDLASYENASTGIIASLSNPASNTGDAAGDVYLSIESLRGSIYADTLTGDANGNKLVGLAGNDTLIGNDGPDTLFGGAGADMLIGGNNSDTASYEVASAGVTVYLLTSANNTGEAAGDIYSAVENLRGSPFADWLVAGSGPNTIDGLAGDDTLDGGAGGNDRLIGGLGADRLIGGTGADAFVYKAVQESTALSMDTIVDFSPLQGDLINFSLIDGRPFMLGNQELVWVGTGGFSGGGTGSVRYRQSDGDTFIEVDTSDRIVDMVIKLSGLISLTVSDFIL